LRYGWRALVHEVLELVLLSNILLDLAVPFGLLDVRRRPIPHLVRVVKCVRLVVPARPHRVDLLSRPSIQRDGAHLRDVGAHLPVHACALHAQEDAEVP